MALLDAFAQLKTLPGLRLIPWPGIIIPNPGGGTTKLGALGKLQGRWREIGFNR